MKYYPLMGAVALASVATLPPLAHADDQAATNELAVQNAMEEGASGEMRRLYTSMKKRITENSGDKWFNSLSAAGLIELDGSYISPYVGKKTSDFRTHALQAGVLARVNEWVMGTASFLYSQGDDKVNTDVATITVANNAVSPLFFNAGRFYLPFGDYSSNMVTDPLTIMGQTRTTALQIGFAQQGFFGSLYGFQGDLKVDGRDTVDSWGAHLGWAHVAGDNSLLLSTGYVNNLGNSGTFATAIQDHRALAHAGNLAISLDPSRRTGGWTLYGVGTMGPVSLTGEYLAAMERFEQNSLEFNNQGAKPSAWNLELGYNFTVFGKSSSAGIAWQGTREARNLGSDEDWIPAKRLSLGWTINPFEKTSVIFQLLRDEDYSLADGGTGKSSDGARVRLLVEF